MIIKQTLTLVPRINMLERREGGGGGGGERKERIIGRVESYTVAHSVASPTLPFHTPHPTNEDHPTYSLFSRLTDTAQL